MTYEAHITVDPITDSTVLSEARVHAASCRFTLGEEPLYSERLSRKQAFLTGHNDNYHALEMRLKQMVVFLQSRGCYVNRYKIEHIVLDSRVVDNLNLLGD